ncbi:MAG: glycosyltransferase [Chloroflexota bacterium]|nr:glycosyltransferase [Chloroflexota bacterium]
MYKGKQIAVVVPAYNEERLIDYVIEAMPDYVERSVVVDDASEDGTAEMVRDYAPQINEAKWRKW